MLLTNRKTFKNDEYMIMLYEYYGCLFVAHIYPNNDQEVVISNMYTTQAEAINSVISAVYSVRTAA